MHTRLSILLKIQQISNLRYINFILINNLCFEALITNVVIVFIDFMFDESDAVHMKPFLTPTVTLDPIHFTPYNIFNFMNKTKMKICKILRD